MHSENHCLMTWESSLDYNSEQLKTALGVKHFSVFYIISIAVELIFYCSERE